MIHKFPLDIWSQRISRGCSQNKAIWGSLVKAPLL